ncbi:MAG TPA: peptidoglycan-associated lipoprotein Pal [Deltaproteobacteria bacterium]|nr:peptidoglycan-associated lipoprotein Pal [Deltaproteobacteria bacterium]
MRSFCLLLFVVLLGFSLVGCSCARQAMKGEETPPKAPEEKKIVAMEEKTEVAAVKEETAPAQPQPVAPAITLNAVYFDFDRYNIRPADGEILRSNLEWFKANPNKKIRIEGHCDERGTVEYNLALGQKRADAAKTYLMNLGVDANALETISYGKERPADPAHNEAAWAKNRRADFVPLP